MIVTSFPWFTSLVGTNVVGAECDRLSKEVWKLLENWLIHCWFQSFNGLCWQKTPFQTLQSITLSFCLYLLQCPKASGHQHTGGEYHCARQRRAAAAHAGQTHHCAVPPGHHWGALQTHLCFLEPQYTVSTTTHTWRVGDEMRNRLKLCNPHTGPLVFVYLVSAGNGGWSAKGCEVVFRNSTHISCQCYHMTSFAVLMDISRREVSDKKPFISTWSTSIIMLLNDFFLYCDICVRTERSCQSKSWRGAQWAWRWASSSSPPSSSSVWEPCSATRRV